MMKNIMVTREYMLKILNKNKSIKKEVQKEKTDVTKEASDNVIKDVVEEKPKEVEVTKEEPKEVEEKPKEEELAVQTKKPRKKKEEQLP